MLTPRTLRFFVALIGLFALLVSPAFFWPGYLDSPAGLIVAVPFLSVYLFHRLGIPGLLEHNGACGWGWCAPTPFGWVFLCAFWLLLAWLLAWALASMTRPVGRHNPP
ncbi:MAG: hypothetical protein J0L97_03960 [Alphaproteobacteria bacterium]|nr:hypothetical protein [Alphaproteobacteria bacterium]